MTDHPFLSYDDLLATTERTVQQLMAGPSAGHPLAVGAVLLFETLGMRHASDALRQRFQDDAERLNRLIEQPRAASAK